MQVKWVPWRESWLTCSDDDTIRLWDVEGCATMSIPYKGVLLPWLECGCSRPLLLQFCGRCHASIALLVCTSMVF